MIFKNPVGDLWHSALSGDSFFQTPSIAHLPEAVQRYLKHAITPGAQLAQVVRLHMHGEIKLKHWLPFRAEEVIVWKRGFIWSATVRMFGMPVLGFDRLIDGEGAMRWKLLGVIPVMTASGPDITRSAAGRVAGEVVWLPSILCNNEVSWATADSSRLNARFNAYGENVEMELLIDDKGQLNTVQLQRWGNPRDTGFHYISFGVIVEDENRFDGFAIPTRLRAGWYFGTDRFESEGEFFRVTIDDAEYR